MRQGRSWMARGIVLAMFALVGLAALSAFDPTDGSAVTTGPETPPSSALDADRPGGVDPAEFADSLAAGPAQDQARPAAICRLRPECSVDSDCDLRCGIGRGKCVHNNCPVRICRCS